MSRELNSTCHCGRKGGVATGLCALHVHEEAISLGTDGNDEEIETAELYTETMLFGIKLG
jgi:hypothetical protein